MAYITLLWLSELLASKLSYNFYTTI